VSPWNGDNYIEESVFVFKWCPECAPEGSNIPEPWELKYCETHLAATVGESDRLVTNQTYINAGEAGGEDSRLLCNLIHRGVVST
jgi:hypothetical protein